MQAVLFDFDGVVVRSMEDHYEGWRKALAEYGIDMSPEELYAMEGAGMKELASQFIRKFNLPRDETANIIQKKRKYYEEIKKTELYPNLIDVLHWIQEKALKAGVVTSGNRERVIAALAEFGLTDHFPVIIAAEDVFDPKPSPESYLRAAALLEVEPAECIAIENSPYGITSAKLAGMKCIALTTTLSPTYLKQADVIIRDLEEVLEALKKMY